MLSPIVPDDYTFCTG